MFRRKSPTLGEKAIKYKMTEFPQRGLPKLPPHPSDLHLNAVDKHEPWHRPKSITEKCNQKHSFKKMTEKRKMLHMYQDQPTSLNELLRSRAQKLVTSKQLPPTHNPPPKPRSLWQRL